MGRRGILLAFLAVPVCLRSELLAIRSYTTADGLAADHVGRIVADSHGFIWFCTPEGLSRFDGFRFVNFGTAEGLPHRVVEDLLEMNSSEYLVGTPRGLCKLLPDSGKKNTAYLPGDTQAENHITSLFKVPTGRVWCGTANGLFEVFQGFKFRQQTLPLAPTWDRVTVTDVLADAGGKLWVATPTGIYVVGSNGAVQHLGTADGLPNEWVNALLLDRTGRLWAGTRGGLVLMRDGGEAGRCDVLKVYGRTEGFSNVGALAEGPVGSIWIGTTAGLSRLLPGSGDAVFRHYTRANGLIDRQIGALTADRAGNLWVGTESAGVMRIQPGGFTTFREQDGLRTDRVWAVLADRRGTVLAVTTGDAGQDWVNVFDGEAFHPVLPKLLRTWGTHQIFLESRRGEWWAATNEGLCRYGAMKAAELGGKRPQSCYAQEVNVYKIFEDSRGGVWASGQSPHSKLMRWDPVNQKLAWFPEGARFVNAFAEDHEGHMWMGLIDRGELYRYDGRQFVRFTQSDGVPGGGITALLVDRSGRLWIGSSGGLGLTENPGSTQLRIRTFDTANGLSSNSIESIVEDNAGRIYAATQKGVDRLNPKTGHIKHFSIADGLAHGHITSATCDASGNLWFATTQGLSRLRPAPDDAPTTPTVLITGLQIGRERYAVSQAGATLIQVGELQPSRNQFRVEFVGFNNETEESLHYSYKLEGGDSNWRVRGRDHDVNYPGLLPGKYRFLVKAVNSEGQESTSPAEIDFILLPPFWRRWWFIILMALALGGTVYELHRLRVVRLVEVERVRTRIATDLHDDVGASLSRVAILTEVVKRQIGPENGDTSRMLTEIAETSRGLVDGMGDIVWSIDPRHSDLRSVVFRIREFGSAVMESQNIRWDFQVPAEWESVKLTAEQRRHLFLIFKEAINNIARHAECSAASAVLRIADNQLLAEIRDDGRGFSQEDGGSGHGLENMKARAAEMGGCCRIVSEPGEGTSISLTLPLRKARGARMA